MYPFILGMLIMGAAALFIFIVSANDRALGRALYTALFVRMGVLLFSNYIYRFPYSVSPDSSRFDRVASNISYRSLGELWSTIPSGSDLYIRFVASVYSFFGMTDWFVTRSINVLLGIVIVYCIFAISRQLWARGVAIQNVWFAAFIPTLIIYAQIPNREAMIVSFFTLGLLCIVLYHRRGNLIYLAAGVASIGVSSGFHEGMLMAIVGMALYTVIIFINSLFRGEILNAGSFAFSMVIIIVGLSYLYSIGFGLEDTYIGQEGFDIETFVEGRQDRKGTESRAAYLQGVEPTTPAGAIGFTPVRVIYFLFAPFPWMVTSLWDIIGLIDSFIYFILVFGIWKSWPLIRKDPAKATLLTILVLLLATFAWGTQNYGTAMRHRAKMLPMMICLAGYVWYYRKIYYDRTLKTGRVYYLRLKEMM